jgi:hypothetical protein
VDPAFFNNGAPDPQPRVHRPIGASLEEKDTVDAINKQLFETQQTQDADQRTVVDAINKQLFDAETTQQKVQDNINNTSPASAKTQPHN